MQEMSLVSLIRVFSLLVIPLQQVKNILLLKGFLHLRQNILAEETQELPVDGVFIAVGIVPVSRLLLGMDVCDEKGYLIAGEDGMTKKPGIFAAGDIRTKKLRQIVTAVADGANAIRCV